MKSTAPAFPTADERALARLRQQQRELDAVVTDGVRMTELLLKQIKAGAPASPVLQEAYRRITRAVVYSNALSRRLQDQAARIAAKQAGEPGSGSDDGWVEIDESAFTRLRKVKSRLERQFFADVIKQPSGKSGRMH